MLHCGDPVACSDFLLVLMQLNQFHSMLALMGKFPLMQTQVVIHPSAVNWMENHKLPIDGFSDILYQFPSLPHFLTLSPQKDSSSSSH